MNADPSIAWRILLSARLRAPVDPARLTALYADQGWAGEPLVVEGPDLATLRRELGSLRDPVVALGVAGRDVVVAADHAAVDGLGLLAVLAAVADSPVSSSARGVGDRPDAAGFAATAVRRLGEVAVRPPARVRGSGGSPDPSPDAFAATTVPGRHGTADLVVAAVRALGDRGAGRRVAVAVGVARDHDPAVIRDRSALLRITDAERLDRDAVTHLLRTAPTATAPTGGAGSGVVRLGLRVLAPRLGSTVLVSHLGRVTAPGVEELAFHPVTGGGSGLSLGAVTLGDSTTFSLRARGRDWGAVDLDRLLVDVVARL